MDGCHLRPLAPFTDIALICSSRKSFCGEFSGIFLTFSVTVSTQILCVLSQHSTDFFSIDSRIIFCCLLSSPRRFRRRCSFSSSLSTVNGVRESCVTRSLLGRMFLALLAAFLRAPRYTLHESHLGDLLVGEMIIAHVSL